jgi:hypothetical protein
MVAVLLPGEALGEGAGDLGLAGGVGDAAAPEGGVLGARAEADALGEAVGQVRRGRGGVEEGELVGGVGEGHGRVLGESVGPRVPERG